MDDLAPEAARELVADLQRRRCQGEDDIALITYVCNRFRVSKTDARAIYDSFYRGFQHGADVSLGIVTRPHHVPNGDPVFDAAAEMAAGHTEAILESKRAATGCGARMLAFVLVGSALLRALT